MRAGFWFRFGLWLAAFGAASCGGEMPMPPTPPSDAPRLVCPQPVTARSLEGVNDLNGGRDAATPAVVNGLRTMVRTARSRGVTPFVATFLPQRPGGRRAFAVNTIVPANEQVRAMASAEGVPLVDLYPVFAGNLDTLLGSDGLHPTEEGYQKIADTFFAAIRSRLETAPSMTSFHAFRRP